MRKLILAPVVALIIMIPGDSSGYAPRRGGGGARPAPAHAPAYHAPSFSAFHGAAAVRTAPAFHSSAFVPRTGGGGRGTMTFHPSGGGGGRGTTTFHPSGSGGGRGTMTLHSSGGGGRGTMTLHSSGGGIGRGTMGGGRGAVGGGRGSVPNRGAYTSRGIYTHRSGGGLAQPGYSHYYNNYAGWHHGYWNGWYGRPWLWGGGGLGAGWLLSSLYNNYYNPYYAADLMPFYDYGAPLAVYDPTLLDAYADDGSYAPPASDLTDPNAVAATQLSDEARVAFRAMDYDKAQALIDKAVKLSPKDPILHEFRALVLFARQRYQEATATIYDVLAVGPGWDWATLQSFYADVSTYTKQLRALEEFARANPNDAASRFLLAYHYLCIEDPNAARRMLKSVIALQPKDQLAAHLLGMLEGNSSPNRPTSGPS